MVEAISSDRASRRASFIVMEDRGIIEAVTSDRDFEQAYFVRLLVDQKTNLSGVAMLSGR